MSLIDRAETRRKSNLAAMDASEQAALGQHLTPHQAALTIAVNLSGPRAKAIRVYSMEAL